MSPVAINGVDHQGVYINGVQVKQVLDAANEVVDPGVFDATTLSAVDADLQAGNIKLAVDIFGFVGTHAGGGVETIELESNGILAAAATYVPTDSGIYAGSRSLSSIFVDYYSTALTAWYPPRGNGGFRYDGFTAISDGANFRVRSGDANNEYTLFRDFLDSGTYERESDREVAGAATYTPADSGFFAFATQANCVPEANFSGAGWRDWYESSAAIGYRPLTIMIGEGANFRVKNTGGVAKRVVLMRAAMT